MQVQNFDKMHTAISSIRDILKNLRSNIYGPVKKDSTKKYCDIIENIVHDFNISGDSMTMRDIFINELCWGIPNYEVIDEITKFFSKGASIEIGCGFGLWCALLKLNGKFLYPYDNCSSHQNYTKRFPLPYYVNKKIPYYLCDRIKNVLIVWPPGECNFEKLPENEIVTGKIKPKRIVFCGELPDQYEDYLDYNSSMTGSFKFHKLLEKEYKLIKRMDNPTWWRYSHDSTYFYEKIENKKPIKKRMSRRNKKGTSLFPIF